MLRLQVGLLGQVTPNLRAVRISCGETTVHLDAYFEAAPLEFEVELMSEVETYLIADLWQTHAVTHALHTLPPPARILKDGCWAYHRYEGAE